MNPDIIPYLVSFYNYKNSDLCNILNFSVERGEYAPAAGVLFVNYFEIPSAATKEFDRQKPQTGLKYNNEPKKGGSRMEIGRRLQRSRMDAGLTQEQAAEALDVTRQTVSNWETGKTYPDIKNIVDISNLYHISLDCLLKEEKTAKSDENQIPRQHLSEDLLDSHLSSAQTCMMRKERFE